jgi:hypothetical protein
MSEPPYASTRVLMRFSDDRDVVIYSPQLWSSIRGECAINGIYNNDDHVLIQTCCAKIKIYDGDAEILRTMMSRASVTKAIAL